MSVNGYEKFGNSDKVFTYSKRIHLGNTNVFQNVYFAEFFDFMGEAREELLSFLLKENLSDLMSSGILLLTRDCDMQFRNSLFAFDEIEIDVSLHRLSPVSCSFEFLIRNKTRNQIAGQGSMTIACAKGEKICRLPELLFCRISDFFLNAA